MSAPRDEMFLACRACETWRQVALAHGRDATRWYESRNRAWRETARYARALGIVAALNVAGLLYWGWRIFLT